MMVSESILTELRFLLVSLLSGAAMILFYDLFRVIRRVIAHGTVWTAVEDFIYWLCCALLSQLGKLLAEIADNRVVVGGDPCQKAVQKGGPGQRMTLDFCQTSGWKWAFQL